MNLKDIPRIRLSNQLLTRSAATSPQEVVSHLVAVQAQEYAMSKWAIGLRLPGSHDTDIEQAFNEGKILRTHLMRPTWHFVAPADIRWLLQLTAPRVHKINAFYYRQQELDKPVFTKANAVFEKVLSGHQYLTRDQLKEELAEKKIIATGLRLISLLMYAELEGLICSGPRAGKQFTYALLEERAGPAASLTREEALAQFIRRYIDSRGPATLQDFATWSGLTVKDATEGAATLPSAYVKETINGQDYYFNGDVVQKGLPLLTFLMPEYDEYGMGYKDRSAILSDHKQSREAQSAVTRKYMAVIDGRIQGYWFRQVKGNKVSVSVKPFEKLAPAKQKALDTAVKKYEQFANELPAKNKKATKRT